MAKEIKNPEQAEHTTSPDETVEKSVQVKFNKNKILGMKRYANRVDLLRVLLKPEKTYTLEAVDAAISDFMKGKVK
jgi:hypothetical protein